MKSRDDMQHGAGTVYERNPPYDGERTPEAIESEIERTRAEMSSTLDAIEKKLSPGQLMDEVLHYLRGGSSGEFVSSLGSAVKQNPMPATLMGIGLAWLMMSNSRGAPAGSVGSEPAAAGAGGLKASLASGREKAGQAAHKAGELAGSVKQKASGVAQGTREKLSHGISGARQQAGRLGEAARQQAGRAKGGFDTMLHEQPLLLGALGIAIGAALGASLPATRREDKLLGAKRDELVQQAKETAGEQMQKVQSVAAAAGQAIKDEADRQDLNREAGEGLLQKAQHVAEAARSAASDEADRQGLGTH